MTLGIFLNYVKEKRIFIAINILLPSVQSNTVNKKKKRAEHKGIKQGNVIDFTEHDPSCQI